MDYLKQWEEKVGETAYSPEIKKAMCLSQETLEGIRMTGMCTCKLVACSHGNLLL